MRLTLLQSYCLGKRLRKPYSRGAECQRKERNEEWGWQESLGYLFHSFLKVDRRRGSGGSAGGDLSTYAARLR